MDTNEPYPADITQLISIFVDRIEQVLLNRGTPRAERTSICQEVETQIQMLIERRIESGAELNIDLVNGIIESMDPPESYALAIDPIAEPTVEPVLHTESSPPVGKQSDSKPWATPPFIDTIRKVFDRPKRTTPVLDWVAICGLAATCFGLFLIVTRPGRGDESAVIGLFIILAGVTASCISFWRIRHSNGLLTGQRIASIGILMLPLLLINALLITILFATPLGKVLGVLAAIAVFVYGNYYIVRYALHWLATYSVKIPGTELPKPDVSADNGMLPSVAN
jgi:hypothetical protein